MNHEINLSGVPHRPGQSTDLEAKRVRAWGRLTDEERTYVVQNYDAIAPETRWRVRFADMRDSYERILYALAITDIRFSPAELTYMLLARWYRNVDQATVRARLADMVNRGDARSTYDGRVAITPKGRQTLDELDNSRTDKPMRRRRGPSHGRVSPGHGASGARRTQRVESVDRPGTSRITGRGMPGQDRTGL